jgi:hypothetical protein
MCKQLLAVMIGFGVPALGAGEEPTPSSKPATAATQPQQPKPLTITVVGDSIILRCEDPQALAYAQKLLAELAAEAATPTLESVHLKNARATDAAHLLDELFNGRSQVAVEPLRVAGAPALVPVARNGTVPAIVNVIPPEVNRIRVIADPGRNALIVRARQSDQAQIRRLIADAIDVGKTDSRGVTRSWLLPPLRYAHAIEVARILRTVFFDSTREGINAAARANGYWPYTGFGPFAAIPLDGEFIDPTQPAPLAIAADERTNSLVVNCSEPMKQEIESVVKRLDVLTESAQRVIRVVAVRNVDPNVLVQALDAVQPWPTPFGPGSGRPGFGPSAAAPGGGGGVGVIRTQPAQGYGDRP